MRVDLDINGARVTITGDRLQVSVAEEVSTRPATSVAADGRPSKPSSEAAGAKMDGAANASPGRAAVAEVQSSNSEQAVTVSSGLKLAPITVLRPHCLSPDSCAGHGRNHCHRCRKVLAEGEAA